MLGDPSSKAKKEAALTRLDHHQIGNQRGRRCETKQPRPKENRVATAAAVRTLDPEALFCVVKRGLAAFVLIAGEDWVIAGSKKEKYGAAEGRVEKKSRAAATQGTQNPSFDLIQLAQLALIMGSFSIETRWVVFNP